MYHSHKKNCPLSPQTGAHEPRAACNMREIVITVLCGVAVLLVPHVTRALPTHKLNRENLEQQIRRLQRMNGQLQLDKVQLRKELARVQQRNHDLLASLA